MDSDSKVTFKSYAEHWDRFITYLEVLLEDVQYESKRTEIESMIREARCGIRYCNLGRKKLPSVESICNHLASIRLFQQRFDALEGRDLDYY